MSQRYGGLFFGYAVILLVSRAAGSSPARTAILAGGAVVTGVLGIISCVGVLTGVVEPFVWSAVVVEGILAAGFLYFLFTSRQKNDHRNDDSLHDRLPARALTERWDPESRTAGRGYSWRAPCA